MMQKHKCLIDFILTVASQIAYADLPLSLEELLTDKGKFKLESSISYINTERNQSEFANPIYVQTSATNFVAVPTEINRTNSNSDTLLGTVGLRYGLTGKTDIYGSVGYLWHNDRQFNGSGSLKNSDSYLSDASLGISHTFLQDGKNPALIGFLETSLYEKSHSKASSGKSWLIGTTTYKAIDPIVLSLTGLYRHHFKKNINGIDYKSGNYIMLNPSVSFAANDTVSLTGGVQWLNAQTDTQNGKKLSARNTSTYVHAGVGYSFTRNTVFNATARWKTSGQSSSELKLGISHSF
ncbi:TPA: meta-pathway of phenol degradation family protein [Neisseria meningitidis]